MTFLVTSILVDSVVDLAARAERASAGGADGVEVRMDAFDGDPGILAEYLKAHKNRTWIVTCRSAEEGGCFRGDTMERVSRLIAAARGTGAYVDFELADWRRSDNIRQKVGLAAAHCVGADTPPRTPEGSDPPPLKPTLSAAAATDGQSRLLILSSHDFERRPENLDAIVHEMIDAHRAVAKVAYRGAHVVDSFAALDLMHEHGSSVIAVCMGEEGLWTRVVAKKFNAFASFCTLAADEATAPGQTTLGEMIGWYRWKNIDRSTKVYGVLGDPIAHSISPFLFNRWFADAGINAVYLPMRVGANGDGLARFLDGCMKRPWLDIRGFSVTIPHKVAARAWVGDGGDSMSQRIGAINTLVFEGDRPTGYNTDCYAAITSLCDVLRCDRSELAGLTVDVLGSGGAARAIVEGLREIGCRVTIYGRSPQRTKTFAEECHSTAEAHCVGADTPPCTQEGSNPPPHKPTLSAAAWEDRGQRRSDVLINCTPVGMWPKVNESPMPADSLGGCRLVFDLIYRPLQTQLLNDAMTAGCTTLNGLDMFVRQAAMQFELWTGRTPDLQQARDLVTRGIHTP